MAGRARSVAGPAQPVVSARLRYLLDTNILSEPARPQPNDGVVTRLRQELDGCATAALVVHELEFGLARLPDSRRKRLLSQYLRDVVGPVPVLPYDAAAARWHALERARLARRGVTVPFVDGQIAAIAHVHGLVLVTRNTDDYAPLVGLRVENWFAIPPSR